MTKIQKSIVSIWPLLASMVFSSPIYAKPLYLDMNDPASSSTEMVKKLSSTDNSQSNDLDSIIDYHADKNNLHPALIKAIIELESSFDAHAVSAKGATGLMQVLPTTAADYGAYNLLRAKDNIAVGSRHLTYLIGKYDGRLPLALAAYNAGEGNVDKYRGIPPFPETQHYVLNVLKSFNLRLDQQVLRMTEPSLGTKIVDKSSPINSKIISTAAEAATQAANKSNHVQYFTIER